LCKFPRQPSRCKPSRCNSSRRDQRRRPSPSVAKRRGPTRQFRRRQFKPVTEPRSRFGGAVAVCDRRACKTPAGFARRSNTAERRQIRRERKHRVAERDATSSPRTAWRDHTDRGDMAIETAAERQPPSDGRTWKSRPARSTRGLDGTLRHRIVCEVWDCLGLHDHARRFCAGDIHLKTRLGARAA
jgi:hypothetical protein